MQMTDRLTLDGTRRTADGYMTAVANVARTGIQEYLGSELGRPDLARVRVYRPADEVFSADAMQTFAHRPVTIDHPAEPVTADNWRAHSVGITGDEVDGRDGKFIRVPLAIMDAKAIRDIEAGKRQLSMGYTCDLDWTAGTTPDGLPYDASQRNIRANHLAVVSAARGGPELKIGDSDMTTRTITVDGIKVQMDDQVAAIVEKFAADAASKFEEMKKKSDEDEASMKTKDAQIATKDAEIATLKSQLADATSAAKIADAARALADTIGKAKSLLPAVVVDGKSAADIRRQVVDAKVGDVAKGWTDDQVAASFGTLTAGVTVKAADTLALALSNAAPVADARTTAHDAMIKRLADAHKTRAA